jgi:Bacterial regulatory proteins, luxR family
MNQLEDLDSRFLFPTCLSPLGDYLSKFCEQSPFSVAIRSVDQGNDIKDKKLIMHNKACRQFWGLSEREIDHIACLDLYNQHNYLNKNEHIAFVQTGDQAAIENTYQAIQAQTVIDNGEGFIRIYKRISTPILSKKVIAICTFSLELTQQANLFYLLQQYMHYYDKKAQAIEKFSHYLHLDHYFTYLPNCGELKVLLAMEQGAYRYKTIAESLHLSDKTVNAHIDAMKDKLKANITLPIVLNMLRTSRQWQPDNWV